MRTIRIIVTAVAIPVLLTACSAANTNGGDESADVTGGGFTGSGDTFFNDEDGLDFANALGGSFSDMFAGVFGGLGLGSDTGSSGGLATSDALGQRMKRAVESDSVDCEGGGSITIASSGDTVSGGEGSLTTNFNNCISDGNRANGGISVDVSGTESNQTVSLNFNNFNSVENGNSSSLNGAVTINAVVSDTAYSTTISGASMTMVSVGESITISNYNMNSEVDTATQAASVSGAATIATTSDGTLTMSISPALTSAGGGDYPTMGAIAWVHSDGSTLTINADSGDPSTFIYIIGEGGTTISGEGKWSETDIGEIAL